MKKLIAMLLALAMALSLVACGSGEPAAETTAAPASAADAVTEAINSVVEEGEVPYIGISIFDYSNNYVGYVRNGIDYYMAEKYPDFQYLMVDGENNQATQTERIDTMISKGVNVLCVNPVDSSAGATILQKAMDAGIAIIFFNRMPEMDVLNSYDKCWYVGEDAYSQGVVQADLVAAEWEKNKETWDVNGDGKLQYVLLKGVAGHSNTEDRANGLKDRLTELGVEVVELAAENADWSTATALSVTETWIGKYGTQIEMVLSSNDAMAMGAVEALKNNGMIGGDHSVPVVGVNALPEAAQLIKDGVMFGSVLTSTYDMATAVIDMAVNAVQGNDILEGTPYTELEDGKIIRTYGTAITAENIEVGIAGHKIG